MNFITKETIVELNGIKIKCERGTEAQVKADLQYVLDRISVKDLQGLKRLVDKPSKLAMARSFM